MNNTSTPGQAVYIDTLGYAIEGYDNLARVKAQAAAEAVA